MSPPSTTLLAWSLAFASSALSIFVETDIQSNTSLICTTQYASKFNQIPLPSATIDGTYNHGPVVLQIDLMSSSTITPRPVFTQRTELATETVWVTATPTSGVWNSTTTEFEIETFWHHTFTSTTEIITVNETSRTTTWVPAPTGFRPILDTLSGYEENRNKRQIGHPHQARDDVTPSLDLSDYLEPLESKFPVSIGCTLQTEFFTTETIKQTVPGFAMTTLDVETLWMTTTATATVTSTVLWGGQAETTSSSTESEVVSATPKSSPPPADWTGGEESSSSSPAPTSTAEDAVASSSVEEEKEEDKEEAAVTSSTEEPANSSSVVEAEAEATSTSETSSTASSAEADAARTSEDYVEDESSSAPQESATSTAETTNDAQDTQSSNGNEAASTSTASRASLTSDGEEASSTESASPISPRGLFDWLQVFYPSPTTTSYSLPSTTSTKAYPSALLAAIVAELAAPHTRSYHHPGQTQRPYFMQPVADKVSSSSSSSESSSSTSTSPTSTPPISDATWSIAPTVFTKTATPLTVTSTWTGTETLNSTTTTWYTHTRTSYAACAPTNQLYTTSDRSRINAIVIGSGGDGNDDGEIDNVVEHAIPDVEDAYACCVECIAGPLADRCAFSMFEIEGLSRGTCVLYAASALPLSSLPDSFTSEDDDDEKTMPEQHLQKHDAQLRTEGSPLIFSPLPPFPAIPDLAAADAIKAGSPYRPAVYFTPDAQRQGEVWGVVGFVDEDEGREAEARAFVGSNGLRGWLGDGRLMGL